MCNAFRSAFTALGCVGLFLAFMPHFEARGGVPSPEMASHVESHPSEMPTRESYRLGWGCSPLMHYTTEQKLAETDDGGFRAERTQTFHVGLFTLSSMTLALGVIFLWLAKQCGPREAGTCQ